MFISVQTVFRFRSKLTSEIRQKVVRVSSNMENDIQFFFELLSLFSRKYPVIKENQKPFFFFLLKKKKIIRKPTNSVKLKLEMTLKKCQNAKNLDLSL